MNKNISVYQLINNNYQFNIIDIRSKEKYNDYHIPGAVHIEYSELKMNYFKYLNKNNNYVIYCKEGKNSSKMCNYLNELGYNTYNLLGGYESWILNK